MENKIEKIYVKSLKIAVQAGAISIDILQRKLDVSHKTACEMLGWMIANGYVKDDANSLLKTTLMTEEEFEELRKQTGYSFKTKREKQRTVDDFLYKACLRLVIKKNKVSETMLKDAFSIGSVRAKAVIERMENDGYISLLNGLGKKIIITKEKFKEIYGEEL